MAPQEESPKIPPKVPPKIPPSFRQPARKEDKEQKIGAISFGGPLAVRGTAPSGLFGRIKLLRPKDISFIAAGLAVLLMAPLAEHFLSGPEEEPRLDEGFDRKGPLFPNGASIYEPGTGGFSPGSLVGQEPDVITPLNVRDPSALVLGPGAAQMGTTGGAPVPTTGQAPAQSPSGWSDALAAAKAGAKEATQKAKLPTPPAKMTGALRGLAALSGGGAAGPTVNLAPLSASHAPNKAKESASLTRAQAVPGFRGGASRSTAPGSPEGLKSAGFRQADILNKGPAAGALDNAAKETMPTGGGAGGPGTRPTEGEGSKNPSNASTKDSKSISTAENLALLAAKLELEKSIDLKYAKKKYFELERQKFREETMFKTGAEMLKDFMGKSLLDPIAKVIAGSLPGVSTTKQYICLDQNGKIIYHGPGTVVGSRLIVTYGVSEVPTQGDRKIFNDKDTSFDCAEIIEVGSGKLPRGGASADGASGPDRNGTLPEAMAGIQVKNAISFVEEELDKVYGEHCGSSPTKDRYSEPFCKQVQAMQGIVRDQVQEAAKKNSEAAENIRAADTALNNAVKGLRQALDSLEETNRALASDDGSVKAGAKGDNLEKARQAYKKALGNVDNVNCTGVQAEASLAGACDKKDSVLKDIEQAKKDLQTADGAVKSGLDLVKAGEQKLAESGPAASIPENEFVRKARGDLGERFKALFSTVRGELLNKDKLSRAAANVLDNEVRTTYQLVYDQSGGPFLSLTTQAIPPAQQIAKSGPGTGAAALQTLISRLDSAWQPLEQSINLAREALSMADKSVKELKPPPHQ